jgi:hypothetical protein
VGPDDEFRPILVRTGGTNSRLGVTFQRDRSGQIAQFLQWVIDGKPLGEPQAMLPPTAVQPDGPPISTDSTTPPSQAGLRATQMNMAAAGCAHQAIDY